MILPEVDRAIDNLVKSGKMFGASGARREFISTLRVARKTPAQLRHGARHAARGDRPPWFDHGLTGNT